MNLHLTLPSSPRGIRSNMQGSTIAAAALLILAFAASANAGSHRARLSSDLAKHFASSNAPVNVIVSGTPDTIAQLAARHHLSIPKVLETGAVFRVSRQQFDALSQDADVD